MAGEHLPGRPYNLTPEEEAKLKQFWRALHSILAVDGEKEAAPAHEDSSPAADKKSKRRMFGLLGRKKETDDDAAVPPAVKGVTAMEGDDKYGQAKEFQKLMATYTPQELRTAFWSMAKHDNPDGLLLRFLRARKWNVQNALVMFMATMQWRMDDVKVDTDICKRGEGGAVVDSEGSADSKVKQNGHDFLEQFRIGKSYLRGTDKEGRPMCIVRVRKHRAGEQTVESLERYTVYTIETARLLFTDGDIDTAALVFDMTDFSLANMDYTPVKFIIKCFEANYPESLGVVLVHKAPWVFQGIWRVIKGWLDPVVAAKVHFTKDLDELTNFVPVEHIPNEMGGKDPYDYEYVPPVANEDTKMQDANERDRLQALRAETVKQYEEATKEWVLSDTLPMNNDKRKALAESLRAGYWDLEPYVRSRTFYDRLGVINPGGKIDFYPAHTLKSPTSTGTESLGVAGEKGVEVAAVNGTAVPAGGDVDGVD